MKKLLAVVLVCILSIACLCGCGDKKPEGSGSKEPVKTEDDNDKFLVEIWPEPFCYEKTDKEKIVVQRFPFTEDGYQEILKYLNESLEEYKE